MGDVETFRRKLRRRLLNIAETRRRSYAGQPSGEDLKVMARCEALAISSDNLDPVLCAQVDQALSDPATSRRFADLWAALPEALGTTLWPRTASELVGWLLREAGPARAPTRRTRLCGFGG